MSDLKVLYRKAVRNRKATMTETEELARWLAELINEGAIALKDGKIQLDEYPAFLGALFGAKSALQGLDKLDDEFKQAELDDYLHLKDTIVASLTDVNVPIEAINQLTTLTIEFIKTFRLFKSYF